MVVDFGDAVFAFLREALDGSQRILCLFNMTDAALSLPMEACLEALHWNAETHSKLRDLTHGLLVDMESERLDLSPYQSLWLVAE
jgi:hypothetical protein